MHPEFTDFSSEEREKIIQEVEEKLEEEDKYPDLEIRSEDKSMSKAVRAGRGSKRKGVGRAPGKKVRI
ncbi:MAG: hypothetical protein PHW53_00800 [Patescibacteria group bacterium]|nr:hypothetical protein [Patescibacteria group bacterium]